ncbi:unnamed protein product [Rotaria sp. Silwood1]|nr:unnamed protein product [Rotaria sp. Silwood1]
MMLSTGANSHPTSIAVGDFNGDRIADIALANNGTKHVDMMIGKGKGKFAIQTSYEIGFDSPPLVMASGDFNNDKRSEIVIANGGSNHVDIFVAYNNGSFENQTRYSAGSFPQSVVVGDLNNDTRLDIVVANYYSNDVNVLLGNGNGSFENQTRYSAGSGPWSVVVGDLNNDTRLDIVVANWGSNDVSILLGNGNGSFENQTRYSAGSYPKSVVVGDLNNDTRLDIVVANWGSNDVSVFLGNGNGSFENQTRYSAGSGSWSVVVGDLNNDTRLDIIVANYYSNDVSVLLGNGNGSFENQTRYSAGSFPTSVVVDDFNNDTRLDIVVANWLSNDVSVLLGYDNVVFVKQMILVTGNDSRPQSLVISDFNNDNLMDIRVVNSRTHNIGIFLGYGNISFRNQMTYSTYPYLYPCSMGAGDFNNDTRVDIVFASCDADSVVIILGCGNGSFGNLIMYSTNSSSSRYSLAVEDINTDTILDIVVAIHDTNYLGVLLGQGNGTFASIILFPLEYGTHPFSIVIGDFNNDRKLDFAVANNGTDSLNILLQTC